MGYRLIIIYICNLCNIILKIVTHCLNKSYPLLSQVGNQADFMGWS